MKKLLLTTSAVALCAMFAAPANAECDGIYGAYRIGMVKHDAPGLKEGMEKERLMMSGALGYRYEYFRTELEYVWRKYNFETSRTGVPVKTLLKTYSYMWNNYYDILPYHWWSPYLGIGLGYTKERMAQRNNIVQTAGFKKTKFTWSLGGGLSLKVTNRLNFDLGYRYYDMGKPKGMGKTYPIDAQEVYAGIRYVF